MDGVGHLALSVDEMARPVLAEAASRSWISHGCNALFPAAVANAETLFVLGAASVLRRRSSVVCFRRHILCKLSRQLEHSSQSASDHALLAGMGPQNGSGLWPVGGFLAGPHFRQCRRVELRRLSRLPSSTRPSRCMHPSLRRKPLLISFGPKLAPPRLRPRSLMMWPRKLLG